MIVPTDNGLVHLSSAASVDETMRRVEDIVLTRGLNIIARVDHSGDAAKVGLTMPPTKLLIFGNPSSGTPLMLAAPSIAIDLPMKILVWRDNDELVRVTYNLPQYLKNRHQVPESLLKSLAGVASIAEEAVS